MSRRTVYLIIAGVGLLLTVVPVWKPELMPAWMANKLAPRDVEVTSEAANWRLKLWLAWKEAKREGDALGAENLRRQILAHDEQHGVPQDAGYRVD